MNRTKKYILLFSTIVVLGVFPFFVQKIFQYDLVRQLPPDFIYTQRNISSNILKEKIINSQNIMYKDLKQIFARRRKWKVNINSYVPLNYMSSPKMSVNIFKSGLIVNYYFLNLIRIQISSNFYDNEKFFEKYVQ